MSRSSVYETIQEEVSVYSSSPSESMSSAHPTPQAVLKQGASQRAQLNISYADFAKAKKARRQLTVQAMAQTRVEEAIPWPTSGSLRHTTLERAHSGRLPESVPVAAIALLSVPVRDD